MSKGAPGVKPFKPTCYYHLTLTKKDWCSYFKPCPMENNITGQYCWACKHFKTVDVQHLLAERGRDADNICTTISNTE